MLYIWNEKLFNKCHHNNHFQNYSRIHQFENYHHSFENHRKINQSHLYHSMYHVDQYL